MFKCSNSEFSNYKIFKFEIFKFLIFKSFKFQFQIQLSILIRFKFLFKSKFLGFVEAPVGVLLLLSIWGFFHNVKEIFVFQPSKTNKVLHTVFFYSKGSLHDLKGFIEVFFPNISKIVFYVNSETSVIFFGKI